ncbi:glutathione S-transferase [Loktanella fryxellensis]|uniref:Glutathione S-transferase n=1 Tax=Loktanella fryxellensis TaxID=245187 RepID=A0A1H7ZU77_9RHOB|nr:glutathione S-transferase family protein [Loktanella fryxellensis]SEM61985.1 glutathione S-transferase [Loktanella fryxellensis]
MLTLHYNPLTVAPTIAIVLEELGLDYTAVLVDFVTKAQAAPAHLALNPKGRVPVLVTDAGVLTETGAILYWLAAVHGPHLVPADAFQAARMRETMYYLAATLHVNFAHALRGARWADRQASWDDMTAKAPETFAASLAYLEGHLDLAPFVVGDGYTLADPWLFVLTAFASRLKIDVADYPKLAAHQAMMNDRASVQAARAKGVLA